MIDRSPKYYLIKSIGVGVLIMGAYFFWLFNSGAFSEARESYLMVTKDKITVSGKFIDTEEFEKEMGEGKTANAYGYKYSFKTKDGRIFEDTGWNYGELPTNIEVEYISDNPNRSRIKGLWQNEETIGDWFEHQILLKLFVLIIFIFFTYIWVKGGITEYRKSEKTPLTKFKR